MKYRWGKNKLFLCKINRYKVNPSNTSSSWICPVRTGNIPLKIIFLLEIRIRYCWVSYISYCNICSMVVIRLFNYTLDNNKLQSGDNSLFITLKIWFIFIYAKPKSLLQGLKSITQRVFKQSNHPSPDILFHSLNSKICCGLKNNYHCVIIRIIPSHCCSKQCCYFNTSITQKKMW